MKDLLDLVHLNIDFPITDPTWIFFLVLVIILFVEEVSTSGRQLKIKPSTSQC